MRYKYFTFSIKNKIWCLQFKYKSMSNIIATIDNQGESVLEEQYTLI